MTLCAFDLRRRLAEEDDGKIGLFLADLDVVEAVEVGRAHVVAPALLAACQLDDPCRCSSVIGAAHAEACSDTALLAAVRRTAYLTVTVSVASSRGHLELAQVDQVAE